MKRYDIKCPICGTLNRDLDLEETEGWMECEKCGTATQAIGILPTFRIPVFHTCKEIEEYLKSQSADHQAAAG